MRLCTKCNAAQRVDHGIGRYRVHEVNTDTKSRPARDMLEQDTSSRLAASAQSGSRRRRATH
ncbi:MAG TPA: hypothetical protein VHM70_18925 [Polyangiaceae bacterium]|nr:hypothetical protein [Polyangiaceae bacterium]